MTPRVVRPVPPFANGNAVPALYVIPIDGVVVGLVTLTLRNVGTDAETVVTVPVPGGAGVAHVRVVPFEVKT